MRINNEYVEIKKGNKVYKKQNMILNTYLKALFKAQLDTTHNSSEITTCYLKLDTPIENVDYDSELSYSDFDIRLISSGNLSKSIIATENSIKVSYNFKDTAFFFKRNDGTWAGTSMGSFDLFTGRQITAIAFGDGTNCFTFLDTTNMNIIINSGERFVFTRVDNITSDGICKGFDYPLHLINDTAHVDYDANTGMSTKAQLYSIGFGNKIGYMEEEYLINNVEVDRDDYSITFDVSRTEKIGHYPSEDLQLGFYPTMDNSKYVMFKYRLYYGDTSLYQYFDEYYIMSKPNKNFGNLEVKLKIERI
jgi:hypothetical protein